MLVEIKFHSVSDLIIDSKKVPGLIYIRDIARLLHEMSDKT
jgi:hypothetical protein